MSHLAAMHRLLAVRQALAALAAQSCCRSRGAKVVVQQHQLRVKGREHGSAQPAIE